MKLSLLSFSLVGDAMLKKLDAEGLCKLCRDNRIEKLDLMREELKRYGKEKLKKQWPIPACPAAA